MWPTDLDGDVCGIGAEAVAVNLHRVAARIRAGVWEELQNLRTVAEGVRSDGEPAVLEIGGQVDGAVRDAWRRARLDLSRCGNGDAQRGLRAEFQLSRGSEVLTGKDDRSSASEGALRRLKTRSNSDSRSRRRQICWRCCIDKGDATIGKAEEELRFVRVLDFRGDALNRRIRNAADELRSMTVENGNERRSGRRLAEIQIFSIPRNTNTVHHCGNIGANLLEGSIQQHKLRARACCK